MKKLNKRLKRVEALLAECKNRQTRYSKSNYYTVFAGEEQREKDIQNLKRIEARLLGYKHTILDSMRIKINAMQYEISNQLREINTNQ